MTTHRTFSIRSCLLLCGAFCAAWSMPAQAMRPFEGTDAAVAEPGVFELELGPLGYVRAGSQSSLVAPAVVGNFGFGDDFEFVIEGRTSRLLGTPEEGSYRTSIGDTAMSIKHVLRKGSMQEGGSGVSIAMECGVLLPEYHGTSGTGGTCAAIASQKFEDVTIHLNTALTRTREKTNTRFLGVILEGSEELAVRPIMEVFAERENNGGHTNSVLVGAIWKHSEDLAFDVGLRHARADGININEVRMGLTWSYAMHN
ncbi:hypothetical protein [Duganella sp. Dugasp56]|uniref:hypothetical protein n=1 Tax=Duganella sp. Dugasp56 TaxID=3243046 RepID=UPI0039AEEA71